MFSIFKGNFMIEKGLHIAETHLDMYPRNMFKQMPEDIKSQMRAGLRNMIENMRLNEHEVAVILVTPYIGAIFDSILKQSVIHRVQEWGLTGLVRPEVIVHFLTEAEKSGDQWLDEALRSPRV